MNNLIKISLFALVCMLPVCGTELSAKVKIIPKFGYEFRARREAPRYYYYQPTPPPCYYEHHYCPYDFPPPPVVYYHPAPRRRVYEERFKFGFKIK